MKKRMMLIINPMAGRSGYKTGFGEVMNILDSGGYLTTVYFTQGRGDATVFAASTRRSMTPWPASAATVRSARSSRA